MENFLVSARKYRPSTFSEMLGQESVTSTLRNSILQQKIAHAYLFCGPRGVGKTSVARIFAKTLNCQNLTPEGEACNACESCMAINEQRSFNLLEMDAASNNSADDIRKINDEVYVRPQYGKYKVYIIDEVHMLSSSAFNTFLKTLEEPPHHVIFILATTEKNKILPTIISRCQVFEFKPIPPETISNQLHNVAETEQLDYETRALDLIAKMAEGGMRDALSIFDRVVSATNGNLTYERTIKSLNILDDEYYFTITNFLQKGDYAKALQILDEILSQGINPRTIVIGLAQFMRNLLVCLSPETRNLFEYTGADADRFTLLAEKCSPLFLYRSIDKLVACDRNYRNSNSKRLLIELTLISIADMSGAFASSVGNLPIQKKNDLEVESRSSTITSATAIPADIPHKPTPQPSVPTSNGPTLGIQSLKKEIPSQDSSRVSSSPSTTSYTNSVETPTQKKIEAKKEDTESMKDSSSPLRRLRTSPMVPSKEVKIVEKKTEAQQPLVEEDLMTYWNSFILDELDEEIYLKQAMQTHSPQIISDHIFQVQVLNDLQKKELEQFSDKILFYLRRRLNNDAIQMEVLINEAQLASIPVTMSEKLEKLIELNEKVPNFIERLGLKTR